MTIRIRATLRPLKAWLSDVVGGTGHHTQFRHGLELTLRCDDGRIGMGEASPLPKLSLESLEAVEAELSRVGSFDFELPATVAECRACIEQHVARQELRTASGRFAFEGALVDLLSKEFGVPAASLVATMAAAPGAAARSELEVSRLLPVADMQRLVSAARHAWSRGYRVLKLKLGPLESFEDDCRTIEALREQLPISVRLRLDPNGSWPPAELPRMLERLFAYGPELVEEPAPAEELVGIERSPVELGLDESLRSPGLLDRLSENLHRLNVRAVVLKPALLGFMNSLAIAEKAAALGLDVIVTHFFDGPVGHATAASLAQAIGTVHRAHGLAPHPGLLLCPERRILGLGGGQLQLSNQPGLPLSEHAHC